MSRYRLRKLRLYGTILVNIFMQYSRDVFLQFQKGYVVIRERKLVIGMPKYLNNLQLLRELIVLVTEDINIPKTSHVRSNSTGNNFRLDIFFCVASNEVRCRTYRAYSEPQSARSFPRLKNLHTSSGWYRRTVSIRWLPCEQILSSKLE